MNLCDEFQINGHLNNLRAEFKTQFQDTSDINIHADKFYVPILRGMRPVTEQTNNQPYIERAQKDYFTRACHQLP